MWPLIVPNESLFEGITICIVQLNCVHLSSIFYLNSFKRKCGREILIRDIFCHCLHIYSRHTAISWCIRCIPRDSDTVSHREHRDTCYIYRKNVLQQNVLEYSRNTFFFSVFCTDHKITQNQDTNRYNMNLNGSTWTSIHYTTINNQQLINQQIIDSDHNQDITFM